MSYSHMSPPVPALKPPSPYQPYSPNNAASPTAQSPYAPPPAKRQRLSPGPGPMSPHSGSPAYGQAPHGLPNGSGSSYGNPYASQAVQSPYSPSSYAGSPQTNSFNTPQPYHPPQQQMQWQQPQGPGQQHQPQRPTQISPGPQNGAGMMPPPPRPNKEDRDERMGVDDIGDSLFGSGINLKDEENYLHNTWTNRHGNESFGTAQSTSFGSSTMSPNGSFNMLTQSTSFGSQGQNRALAGNMSEQPRSQEQIDAENRQKREAAARKKAEIDQYHLNNQFLSGNCLRNRMHKRATENAVRLDITGVYVRNPQAQPQSQTRVMVNGVANEGIVEAKAESMIEAGVPYDAILTLISLAAGERLRGMVDDAYGLARARRYGDHGRVVPPEFADIAVGEGAMSQETVAPESITNSQWEQSGDRPNANGEASTNGEKDASLPVQTVSFQGTLNARLRELADRDKQVEKERDRKREARRRKLAAEGGDESMSAEIPAELLAQPAAAKPLSKKEQIKRAKENSTEVQTVRSSNQTAAMMIGGKNRRSWMNAGGDKPDLSNRYAKPAPSASGSGTATPKVENGTAALAAAAPKPEKVPTWGDWREDSVNGKGIELRDWVRVLERDGKEMKALQKALNKLA